MDNNDNGKMITDAPYSRRRKSTAVHEEEEIRGGNFTKEPTALMLINEISRLFGNHMRAEEKDFALGGSYRALLFHLAQRDGRTQLELAKLTHLKAPTVSLSLAKLESEGYVVRRTDPEDMRQTRVYLTDRGLEVDRRARAAIDKIEERAAQSLTGAETEQLKELLLKLRDNLNVFDTGAENK